MKKHSIIISIFTILLGSFLISSYSGNNSNHNIKLQGDSVDDTIPDLTTENYIIHNPIKSNNLQIFFISGKEEYKNNNYITLDEALTKGYVKVKETGSVGQLSIDNKSKYHIYIQSGEIVKGGKQDRTLGEDMIISPNSKDQPLKSFCVEQGRWRKRGNEDHNNFTSSKNALSSRALKIASRHNKNQGEVWSNVSYEQKKLNDNVSKMCGKKTNIVGNVSASSLQLTLENKLLDSIRKTYEKAYINKIKQFKNVIGYAYAINGEIYSIDIYSNPKLFGKLWSKLIEATITEAISDKKDETEETSAKKEDISKLMNNKFEKVETKNLNDCTSSTTEETDSVIYFNTVDKNTNRILHKNYIVKPKNGISNQRNINNNRGNLNRINQSRNINQQQININQIQIYNNQSNNTINNDSIINIQVNR